MMKMRGLLENIYSISPSDLPVLIKGGVMKIEIIDTARCPYCGCKLLTDGSKVSCFYLCGKKSYHAIDRRIQSSTGEPK